MRTIKQKLSQNNIALAFCAFHLLATNSVAQEIKPVFDILHLWGTDAEQKALEVIRKRMKKIGVEWSEQAVTGNFKGVRTEFAERNAVGVPPSAVFWIGDKELRHLIEEDRMRLIDNEVNGTTFSSLLRKEVFDVVQMQGGVTSVPIGIHIQNSAIYNLEHLKKVGKKIPKTWTEFISTAKLLKEAGFIPFSMSSEAWQMRPLILSILSEQLPPDEFEAIFVNNHKHEILREKLIASFDILNQLRSLANTDYKNLYWQDSVLKVRDNIATANFLGDFNSPMIENNKDVVCAPPPGNSYIVWSFDTAVLSKPANQSHQLGQNEFIKIVSTQTVQEQYIAAKGGLSVFQKVDESNFQRCSKVAKLRWNNSKHKFHLAGGAWSQHLNVITNVAKSFWEAENQSAELHVSNIIDSLKHLREFENNEDN